MEKGAGCFLFPLICGMCTVCIGLFAGRLWSLIVALLAYLPYHYENTPIQIY